MANKEHLEFLMQGVDSWHKWRSTHTAMTPRPGTKLGFTFTRLIRPDLTGADLKEAKLSKTDLSGVDLRGADLSHADLSESLLSDADLSEANLSGALLWDAKVFNANL